MKAKYTKQNTGLAMAETLIIAAIIIIIIVLIARSVPGGYIRGGYTSTNSMGQTTTVVPSSSATTYTTTTTTTGGGYTTTSGTGGGTVIHTTNERPVITLYGDNPYNLSHPGTIPECDPNGPNCPPRGDVYVEPGYKATDREDGNITSRVTVKDQYPDYSTSKSPCRTWYKVYTVTDSNGNTATATRTINECFLS